MRPAAVLLLLLQHRFDRGFCLILKRIRVPGLVWSGRDASLHCDFDTQGEELYSVKWYKGGQEVFRWLPSQLTKPITIYPRPGVRIDQNKSSATSMALQAVDLSSTGRYRCEVSTEAPMFSTASDFGDLLVVSPPPGPPFIQGDIRETYQPGDLVHLNCTSRDSKPAADLSWKINNQTADSSYIIPHPVMSSPSGLLTSVSELFLTLGKRHFTQDGRIRIECEARIGRSSQPSTATTLPGGTLQGTTLAGGTLPGATLLGATLPGGTLATKPSSSRLPPEATTVHMIRGGNPDSRASNRNFLTTLSTGPTTTVAADLKSVALNISSRTASQPHSESRPPTSDGKANSESNLNKKSLDVQIEKRPKTERDLETTTQTAT